MVDETQQVVRVTEATTDSPVVVVCEHASARIPAPYADLGLGTEARRAHIAWDPGALAVAQTLAGHLGAALVAGCVSRLVYDCNRPPDAPDAMPVRSENYDIPGNAALSPADRAARVADVYTPFRAALAAEMARHTAPVLVTVHSFTPVFNGIPRETEIGILHDADARLADAMLAAPPLPQRIDRNAPYGPDDGVTHTLRAHALPRAAPNVMIEIRSDLIETAARQAAMGRALADWIGGALASLKAASENGASA